MAEIVVKIRPALTALKIGESITFPISKLKSVRCVDLLYGCFKFRVYMTK